MATRPLGDGYRRERAPEGAGRAAAHPPRTPGPIRTDDPWLRRPLLYPAELRAQKLRPARNMRRAWTPGVDWLTQRSGGFVRRPRDREPVGQALVRGARCSRDCARSDAEPALDAPFRLPAWATYVQYGFDLVVVFAISIAGYGRFWRLTAPQDAARYPILLAGALLMAVLPAMLPVATPHYWTFQIPLVAMLLAERRRRTGRPSPGHIAWAALALVAFAATGPDAPGILSRLGPTTIIMLVPVVVGLVALRRTSTDDARPKHRF